MRGCEINPLVNRDADPLAAEPLEKLALGTLAGLCGFLLFEVAAGVSGWAFGGGWVWSSFASMPATLARLTHHLDEPRRAWPPSVRRMLPGALAFYGSLGAVFVATAGLALALLRAVAGDGPEPDGLAAHSCEPSRGDVLLATSEPAGLSARNILSGRLLSLSQRDAIIVARVDCGIEMSVHLTLGARDSLGLVPGRQVWVIVKTHSCHLLAQ